MTTESTKAVVGITLSSKSSIDKYLEDRKNDHKRRHNSFSDAEDK